MGFEVVLVTGAGGFLGSHLTERALKRGQAVIAVDNFSTSDRSNRSFLEALPEAKDRLFFVEANVCEDWSPWLKEIPDFITKKVNTVFHFASPASPPLYQKLALETLWVNSIGTQKALEFADRVNARVVFASTSEIYGDPNVSPQPESYWGNVNSFGIRACYDEAKRFGEALLFTHNFKKQTKHGLVRIFNTYGPRMNPNDGRVVVNLLMQALRGENLTIYGQGFQTRSFCYVDDLCAGIEAYAKSECTEPINLGNDREFTILQLAETIQKMFSHQKLEILFQPIPKDDPKHRRPDLTKALTLLKPWAPQIQLEQGLQQMRAWLEKEVHS